MATLSLNTVEPPDITNTINQQFFIEPQGGPKNPVSYLDAFPETLYNKTLDSNLVALMYALLGPSGIGILKKNFLEARLAIEANGLRTTDLDALYASPFSFARLALETYEDDTEGLLPNAAWERIQISDASYKNRAINYLKATRAGGTLLGLTLAAKSGLDHAVEVVENYRALYDRYSDSPLGLDLLGVTRSTEEVILLPRQELPKSSQQTLSVLGSPVEGVFRLAIPLGANGEVGSSHIGGAQNNTETGPLPFNISFDTLRSVLEALPIIGQHNVEVSGGPFPGHPLIIRFTGALADRPIPPILVTENTFVDVEQHRMNIEVTVDQVGVSADGEIAAIPPEDWYFAQVAIDHIKPVTAIVTPGKAPGITKRQPVNMTFADSEFVQVLRYVTGRRNIPWPPVDSFHWIEPGIEHEGPVSLHGQQAHYVNFHDIATAIAYDENNQPDEHVGIFSKAQRVLFPFLDDLSRAEESHQAAMHQYQASEAIANPVEPLTTQAGAISLIKGIYPPDYAAFASITAPPTATTPFWASTERTEGIDYLEIDLGQVQGVNTVQFEVIDAPYNIAIEYDLLDTPPQHRFIPVTLTDPREVESVLSIGYTSETPNAWAFVPVNFENSLGNIIFTRFIRIQFKRRPGSLKEANEQLTPYGVEVRNLRVGRNLAP